MADLKTTLGILKIQDVMSLTGLSEATIWRLEKRGDFPAKKRLSPNRVGWIAEDVQSWIFNLKKPKAKRRK